MILRQWTVKTAGTTVEISPGANILIELCYILQSVNKTKIVILFYIYYISTSHLNSCFNVNG